MKTFKLSALALGALALSVMAPMSGAAVPKATSGDEAMNVRIIATLLANTRHFIYEQTQSNGGKWKPMAPNQVTYLAKAFERLFYTGATDFTETDWQRYFDNILTRVSFNDIVLELDSIIKSTNVEKRIDALVKEKKLSQDLAEEFKTDLKKRKAPFFVDDIKLPKAEASEPAKPSRPATSSGTERNEPYTLQELDAMLAKSKTPEGREELEDTPSLFSQLNFASKSPNRDIVARAKNILNNLNNNQEELPTLPLNNQEELPTLPLIEDGETTSQEAIAIPNVISSNWLSRSASAVGRNMRSINAIAADKDKVNQLKELAKGGDKNAKIILDAVAKHHKI